MELHQRLRRLSTRSSARRHGQRADIPAQQDPPISAAVPSSPGIPDGTLEETALPTPTSSHGTITETVSETFKARPVHIILRIIPTPSSAPVHDQLQSPFFSKLPPEIRLMIYEYALGDTRTVIHLAHKRDGSIQAVFDYDLNDQFAGSHGCLAMDRMRPADLDPSSIGGSFLDDEKEDCTELVKKSRASSDPAFQFLQTCQRVYFEATETLLQQSALHMRSPAVFHTLSASLPSSTFRSLHRLWFSIYFPVHFRYGQGRLYPPPITAEWRDFCTLLASLNNLTDLRVELRIQGLAPTDAESSDYLEEILLPLTRVRAKQFHVNLEYPIPPWALDGGVLGEVPFVVQIGRKIWEQFEMPVSRRRVQHCTRGPRPTRFERLLGKCRRVLQWNLY